MGTLLKKLCSDRWFGGVGGVMVVFVVLGSLNLSRFLGFGGMVVVVVGRCCECLLNW